MRAGGVKRWLKRVAIAALLCGGMCRAAAPVEAAPAKDAPLPDIRQLMMDVMKHQREMDAVRENYTYHSTVLTEELDSAGRVTKTSTEETDTFFVNSHRIERTVKRDGKPLEGHDLEKEDERVKKLVEKAEKVPPGQALEGPNQTVSITQLLDIMQVIHPRRVMYKDRPTIVFDFAGRRDAKTHGLAEDASKKLAGTLWVDEKDKEVSRMEAHFTDNFHVGAGLLANIQRGSSFYFDQGVVNGEIWLPTGGEFRVQARVLLLKGIREHVIEHDSGYEKFSVQDVPGKTVIPKS